VHAPSMAACAVAQQEIFNDKLAVATGERSPTDKAGYVVEGGLSSSFDFDDLIPCGRQSAAAQTPCRDARGPEWLAHLLMVLLLGAQRLRSGLNE